LYRSLVRPIKNGLFDAAKNLTPAFRSEDELVNQMMEIGNQGGTGKKKKQKASLVKSLNTVLGYGTDIIEHFIIQHDIDPKASNITEVDPGNNPNRQHRRKKIRLIGN